MLEDTQLLERIKRDVLFGHDIAPPSVDADKCRGCGLCVRVCPVMVFELRDKKSKPGSWKLLPGLCATGCQHGQEDKGLVGHPEATPMLWRHGGRPS